MNIGIALGVATREMVDAVLSRAIQELRGGNSVELFLVFNGVGLYELVEKEPSIGKLLDQALEAGMTLSACRSCELVHGAKKASRRRPYSAFHLIGLWWRSERFVFANRFKDPKNIKNGI